jgi:hypothetical protein
MNVSVKNLQISTVIPVVAAEPALLFSMLDVTSSGPTRMKP